MDVCLLLKLPEEILKYIGGFLAPRDLIASSATCHTLRAAFNDNLIWRKYTDGGEISRRLDGVPSVVEPVYRPLELSTLNPLCQNRQHFLKESRLLHNLRLGKYVKHSIHLDGYLLEFENRSSLRKREVTYVDEYLFTFSYKENNIDEIIHVYNIKTMPYLFTTVELENHVYEYSVIICIQVIKTRLVVRQDHWFDVYQINFPCKDIPLVQSFQIDVNPVDELRFGHFLFYSNEHLNIVRIWNLDTLGLCNDIHPKINGINFRVLACSENFIQVLLCVGMNDDNDVHLFVYNIQTQNYLDFNVAFHSERYEFCGLIEGRFVVIVSENIDLKFSVHLFDVERSIEIASKNNVEISSLSFVVIKNGLLCLPLDCGIIMLNLPNLEIVHELQFDSNILLPQHLLSKVEYVDFPNLYCLLIIDKNNDCEIWDFEKVRKLDVIHGACGEYCCTVSKFIIRENGMLSVLSFW